VVCSCQLPGVNHGASKHNHTASERNQMNFGGYGTSGKGGRLLRGVGMRELWVIPNSSKQPNNLGNNRC
jgi:hypothetical protein